MHTLNSNPSASIPPENASSDVLNLQNPQQKQFSATGTESQSKSQPDSSFGKILLSWQALKFESAPKSNIWYIVVFLVLVSLVAYGLFSDNFPLAILAILIGLLLYLFEKKEPQSFKFGVTSEGVFAQNSLYKFSSLENFWIFYEPNGRKDLSLKSNKAFIPYIQIPLGELDPTLLRETLLEFLPEAEHEEAVMDSLERLL